MTSHCLKCLELVPSFVRNTHDGVFLVKRCPICGETLTQIESDFAFYLNQEELPRTDSQNDCYMVDITTKCDAGCRSCYSRGSEHTSLLDFMQEVDALPAGSRVLISGGEPLQRPNFELCFSYASAAGHYPILLTNGAYLTEANYRKLLSAGLYCAESPQIAVSLGVPGTNTTFDKAYDNLKRIKVSDIAFTVTCLDELDLVHEISEGLRGHYDAICIRTAWDGATPGLHISEMVQHMNGGLVPCPTLHGYRNAMVEKDGIIYKILSWPTKGQYDVERYRGRGVWYKGANVVETLINALPLP